MQKQASGIMQNRSGAQRGFTLVEMIVAVGLFAVVTVVCVGALLALVTADRKAQALQQVMNNLNITLDSMVRNIRQGSSYQGTFVGTGSNCSSNSGGPSDCTGGTTDFRFKAYCSPKPCTRWLRYRLFTNQIWRADNAIGNNTGQQPITSPEIKITKLTFYVVGTNRSGDTVQPKVIIVVTGTAGVAGTKTQTTFHIQATAVQRALDL